MKMIYAIVQNEDGDIVTDELTKQNFFVTRLATTGGFLRKGNTTLLVGTDEDKVDAVIDIVRRYCAKRKQISYNMSYTPTSAPLAGSMMMPVMVDAGGATIFVLDVSEMKKI